MAQPGAGSFDANAAYGATPFGGAIVEMPGDLAGNRSRLLSRRGTQARASNAPPVDQIGKGNGGVCLAACCVVLVRVFELSKTLMPVLALCVKAGEPDRCVRSGWFGPTAVVAVATRYGGLCWSQLMVHSLHGRVKHCPDGPRGMSVPPCR